MPLTLSQFLFLIIALAVVAAVTVFIVLAMQLKRTAAEAEKTLAEYRELAKSLQLLDRAIKDRVDELGQTLQTARQAAGQISGVAMWLTSKVVRPASKWWPLVAPLAQFVWRQWKKRKEKHHVRT